MDLGLKGKVAVITGASAGIGRSIVLGFAAEGVSVAICARHEGPLRTAVFLASERAGWVTGACISVDGGQHKGNL